MSTRERRPDEQIRHNPGNDDNNPASPARRDADRLREHTAGLLATARGVIDNTLSGESEDYLTSVRQDGGQ
jgi:hypothetical protein